MGQSNGAEGHLSKGSIRRNKRIIAVIVASNDTNKLYSDRVPMLLALSSFLLLSHPVLLFNGALKTIAFRLPRPNDSRALQIHMLKIHILCSSAENARLSSLLLFGSPRNNIAINATRKPFHTKTITLRCEKTPPDYKLFSRF